MLNQPPVGFNQFVHSRFVAGNDLSAQCFVSFGVFSLLTVWAGSFDQLFALRLLAGIGLGGAAPNVVALASEYAPKRMRSALVTLLWAAFPFGGVLMGLLGGYPWRTIFYLGGMVPLVIAVVLLALLPESPAFLVTRGASPKRVAAIVSRIAPDLPPAALEQFTVTEEKLTGVPMKHLFSSGQGYATAMLWIMFFCDFLILVSVNAWMPALLRANGFSVARAGFAIAWNSIGSTAGAILVGRLMDRFGAYGVLNIAFLAAAMFVAALGFGSTSFSTIAILATFSGFFAGAAQAGVVALAARTYPVAVRSTGIGWAMAVGRLGAVVGPLAGGILLTRNFPASRVFLSFAIPGLCGAAAVLLLRSSTRAPVPARS